MPDSFDYRVRAESPNDPKLSDCGARRAPCAGEGGEGAKVAGSTGHDARNSSLQRMVRRRWESAEWKALQALNGNCIGLVCTVGGEEVRLKLTMKDAETIAYWVGYYSERW